MWFLVDVVGAYARGELESEVLCGWRRERCVILYVFYLSMIAKELTRLVSAYKLFIQPTPAPPIARVVYTVNSNVLHLLSITLVEYGQSAPSLV